MYYKNKVRGIFSYLLNVKNLGEKITRNILDYNNLYWESQLEKIKGCTVNNRSDKEWWIRVSKECSTLYEMFFKLYFYLEKGRDDIEILWGHGFMTWETHNKKIAYPILTTKMKLSFDNENEAFTLSQDSRTIINTSIFSGINIPNSRSLFELEDKLSNISLDPRNIESVEKIFNQVLSYLSTDGRVVMDSSTDEQISFFNHPVIYNRSVIFIRKNDVKLWQREIANIIKQIDKGYPIPETIKALVQDIKIEKSTENYQEWGVVSEGLLFPLQESLEEEKIIKRIGESYGVVVQKSSGIEKSNTIVNLICHLIAKGKKVLVTSETDRELKILSQNIPKEIKPFCLSVLGNDTNSLKEIEESVKKVEESLKLNPQGVKSDIERLKESLNICKRNQSYLFNKFSKIQRIESGEISYGGEFYKIIDVAKWVKENRGIYSWIEDEIHKNEKMPLTKKEFETLRYLLKEVSKEDKNRYDTIKFMLDKLPSTNELCESVSKFKELSGRYESYIDRIKDWRIPDNNRCNYDNLLSLLRDCKMKIGELENDMFRSILNKYLSSEISRESFKDSVRKCNDYISILRKIRKDLKNHNVVIPSYVDIYKFNDDFNGLYESLILRRRIGKVFKLIHPEYNYIIKECKVDHQPLENRKQASLVKLCIQEKIILRELKILWNNTVKEHGGKIFTVEVKDLELIIIEEYIKKLNIMVNWDKDYKSRILVMLGKILIPENIEWYKKETYDYLIDCVQSIKSIEEYNKLRASIQITKKLISHTGKLGELYDAIEELDINKIKVALNKIERINMLKDKFLQIDSLTEKLSRVCPNTLEKIINKWDIGEDTFNNWLCAWRWANWNSLLKELQGLNPNSIIKSIEEEKKIEKKLIEEIIAKKALYNQLLKTSECEKRSLLAWVQAMKKIGKGTGRMVSEYRKIAQNEMEICKNVIPVWIMPLNKVIENIKLSDNLFDVIIFDESNQSDIFSTCALIRAEKAIVFGNEKQLTKESIKVDGEIIESLINKHLKDIPQKDLFDLQTDFYGTALRTFQSRLMIKEYSSCIPKLNSKIKNIDYVFRSTFHKDFYSIIRNKGYSIVPEVKIGLYKIDFLIEGKGSKLAIICDGDSINKNYNWEESINRQLDLEREGIICYRIRGSEFYYDTESIMNKLWNKLRDTEIDEFKNKNILTENLKVV